MQNSRVLVASIAVLKPPQNRMPPTNPTSNRPSREYFALGFFRKFHRRAIAPGCVSVIWCSAQWRCVLLLEVVFVGSEEDVDRVIRRLLARREHRGWREA